MRFARGMVEDGGGAAIQPARPAACGRCATQALAAQKRWRREQEGPLTRAQRGTLKSRLAARQTHTHRLAAALPTPPSKLQLIGLSATAGRPRRVMRRRLGERHCSGRLRLSQGGVGVLAEEAPSWRGGEGASRREGPFRSGRRAARKSAGAAHA